MALHLPSPPVNGFHIGPAFIHFYGLMYVFGITAAILITQRRWKAQGGDPALVGEVALWGVPAGIIGGRIYFDLTTPKYIPHHWYGVFAVWDGGQRDPAPDAQAAVPDREDPVPVVRDVFRGGEVEVDPAPDDACLLYTSPSPRD